MAYARIPPSARYARVMRSRRPSRGTVHGFAYATQGNLATVIFAMENRRVRFVLELPDPENFRYTNHNPPQERGARA